MNLFDICDIGGQSVKSFDGEKKYIATGDIINNEIISGEIVNYKSKPSRANVEVGLGDVLFAKMMDTVKVLKVDELNKDYIYSTGFYCMTPKADILQDYLYLYFNSDSFNSQKNKNCSGATQKAINNDGLSKIVIKSIPSVEEQKEIINKLSNINNLIKIKKEEIKKLNLLIKSQFVEMFDNKDFPYVKFKEYMERCVDIGSNGANAVVMDHYNMTDEKDYAMVIRFTNLNSGDFEKDVKYLNKDDYEFFCKSKVYGDEIIFCKIGSAGMNYIMPRLDMPVTLGLNQIMVTPKDINTRYLYEYINSYEGKKYINNNINGAVTKTITKHALWEFPIKTPPIELQNKFAQIAEQIDKQKFEFESSLKKLEELQASLMQEYFG